MTTWANQALTFTYYFPAYGDVFTDSPINFLGDGSLHLSTFANLEPATFSVTGISPWEVQIAYVYPASDYPSGFGLTNVAFNGFTISGPAGITPITAVVIDPSSTIVGLTDAALSFTDTSATINLAGTTFPAGSVALIDVYTPEPASVAILASALLLLVAMTRLRRLWLR
jgi:hypothetical protein